ncbi:unnamed protein product, partial [Laminaria digitata]
MVSVRYHGKLKSFRSYLAGRKKAGVVKLAGGGSLFLLPKSDSRSHPIESIVGLVQGVDAVAVFGNGSGASGTGFVSGGGGVVNGGSGFASGGGSGGGGRGG